MEKGKITCVKDFFMDIGDLAFKAGVEYEYQKEKDGGYWFKSEVYDENVFDGFNHSMTDEDLQEAFGTQGEVSKSMGVDTKDLIDENAKLKSQIDKIREELSIISGDNEDIHFILKHYF